MARQITQDQQDALDQLRALLPPGSTVSTILRHVSRSGMYRAISLVKIGKDGSTFHLDYLIQRAGIGKVDERHNGLKAGGCGMDMGFALVYGLGRSLYPNGHKCTGHRGDKRSPRCPSNDHNNDYGILSREARAAGMPHDMERNYIAAQLDRSFRRSRTHSDGGYAISQRWL